MKDYRPICCANYLTKIISKICCNQLSRFVEKNECLSQYQSAFRNGYSCTTAILKLTEDIHISISKGKCVILVLLDFSNAFPSVDHKTLLQVLESIGIQGKSLQWFKNYITGWNQKVKFNNKISNEKIIERGVIQGENNSQLLFSLVINNITKYIKHSKYAIFADDFQLYKECDIENIEETVKLLCEDMNGITKFGEDYNFNINPSKSKAIILSSKSKLSKINYNQISPIKINNEIIEYVNKAKNLGYIMNRTNDSSDHINEILRKVYYSLSGMQPLRELLPECIKLKLIKSLILPIFDYMNVVYHNFGTHGFNRDEKRIEVMFNNCIRFIANVKRSEHISPYRKKYNLTSQNYRRSNHVATLIFKIINNMTPKYLEEIITKNQNNTRSTNKLIIQKPQNSFQKSSFRLGAPIIWNSLPEEIRATENIKQISNKLKEYYFQIEYGE